MANLTRSQEYALDQMKTGKNIFLTGSAGAGKSFIVEEYEKWCAANGKIMIKTAPTGIAAINIHGSTLHSQFCIRPGIQNLDKIKVDVLKIADVLLIDEISMVRVDLFSALMKKILALKKHVQIILTGDFFQLPPVITRYEKQALQSYLGFDPGEGWCFLAKEWAELNLTPIILKEIVRQEDEEYMKNLESLKLGNQDTIKYFNTHTNKKENDGVWLTGTNRTADNQNKKRLKELPGPTTTYYADYDGNVSEKSGLVADKIELKPGAQVIFISNDPDKQFVNGTVGEVLECNEDSIIVEANYQEITVVPFEYPKTRYKIVKNKDGEKEIKQETTGTAYQYPLKLGWAITIHKSQGTTLEELNLAPEIFTSGQLYVALSRCKTIQGIHLTSKIQPQHVQVSPTIKQFWNYVQEMAN